MERKNTLIVNIFGHQKTGKSTCASYIFAQLRMLGIDCEYISDYFSGDYINDPLYVVGCQSHSCKQLFGNVDVIINDNPILMGCLFIDREHLTNAIVEEFMSYGDNNLNLLFMTEDDEENKDKTEMLKNMFRCVWSEPIQHMEVNSGIDGCNAVIELILKILKYAKEETLD